jgi:hypothetical protein
VEEEEDKMPPKMRKRWMHREAVALRERYGSPAPVSPCVSVSVPPPTESGDAELEDMRMDVDGVRVVDNGTSVEVVVIS